MNNYPLFQTDEYMDIVDGYKFSSDHGTIIYSTQKFMKIFNLAMVFFPDPNKKLINSFIKDMKAKHYIPVIFSFDKLEHECLSKATVIVELSEDLWDKIDKDQRTAIRKAKKENVQVKDLKKNEEWKEYLTLLKDLKKRKNLLSLNEKEFWECYKKKSFCKLKGAYLDNKLIGGALFFLIDGVVLYKSSACHPKYYKYQPIPLILWELAQSLTAKGFKILDMGGYSLDAKKGSPKYGINRFKSDWGPVVEYGEYSSSKLYFILKKINGAFLGKINRLLRWKR